MGSLRLVLTLLLVSGCGDSSGGTQSPELPDSRYGGYDLPEPGTHAANWEADYESNTTPDTAFPVGIVTVNDPYVLSYIEPSSGDVFYVFRTGPDFTHLDIKLYGNEADVTHMHIHEGNGLKFGSLLADGNSSILNGDWDLSPDSVYVLEIHANGGGFV